MIDSWAQGASGNSNPISVRSAHTGRLSDTQKLKGVQEHGCLWSNNCIVQNILVLLASAFLMLLMLSCLPECRV